MTFDRWFCNYPDADYPNYVPPFISDQSVIPANMLIRRAIGLTQGFRSAQKCVILRKLSTTRAWNGPKGGEGPNGSGYWGRYWSVWKANPLPIGVGLSVIAFIQFSRIRKKEVKVRKV